MSTHQPPSQTHPLRPRRTPNPALQLKITQMRTPLSPLVSLTTGTTHAVFPSTLLHFWLLTSAQLDELAHFYHQRTPGPYTAHYPCPVYWDAAASLEDKRRRIGRFIGLRGCESPVRSVEQIEQEVLRERERRAGEEEWFRGKGRWC